MNRIKRGINPKVAEIGKIKIGRHNPKKHEASGRHLPQKLDHFLVTTTEKDRAKVNFLPDEKVMESLKEKYGEEPKEIPIIFPFDDPQMIFQTSYAFYAGRQCLCRGDGIEATRTFLKDGKPGSFVLLDSEDNGDSVQKNERRKIACDPETCPHMSEGAKQVCKPNGRLCVIIPASERLNGYYFHRTTSYNTISFITAALDKMKIQTGGKLNKETGEIDGGTLAGIPAKIFTFKTYTESHGNVQVSSVDWDYSDKELFRQAVISENRERLDFGKDIKLIESQARQSGILEDRDPPEEVEQEFYSQNTEEHQEQKKKIATSATDRADSVLGDVSEAEDAITEEVPKEAEPEEVKINKTSATQSTETVTKEAEKYTDETEETLSLFDAKG